MSKTLSCKPSAFYYRQALRSARTKGELVEIGLNLVGEIERLKAYCRAQGFIPPKWYIMQTERDAKALSPAAPLPPPPPPGMAS